MRKILLVGDSARMDCMLRALTESPSGPWVYVYTRNAHPGLRRAYEVRYGHSSDVHSIVEYARECKPDFVVIGPEEPLVAGIVDRLNSFGIPCLGPSQILAQLEGSKRFTRAAVQRFGLPGNPQFRIFYNTKGLWDYIELLDECVVKPDGLTGGKGVRVYGTGNAEQTMAYRYASQVIDGSGVVLVEKRLVGQEFSLHFLLDGNVCRAMPLVQDYKRAYCDDRGPNTGGMGSYSMPSHLLPCINKYDVLTAQSMTELLLYSLQVENDRAYRGVLYGGFIKTDRGIYLLEYNVRFGDPEIMNLMAIFEGDFADVCESLVTGDLATQKFSFESKATVCKYVVPNGYPHDAVIGDIVGNIPSEAENLQVYYGAVRDNGFGLQLQGSRAIACVATGATVAEAEIIAETAAMQITGPVFHREDIGKNIQEY